MNGGEGIRILHVDDEAAICDVVATHLERLEDDFDVLTETSARDGLEHIEDGHVDCVVSDLDMPGMDGLEFLRAVREVSPELPFILFTGKGSEDIAAEAITAGVTEYLQKRTGSDQYTLLANRIRRAVGEQRAKTALEESERMLSTLIANLPGMVYRCRNEPGWPMTFVSDGAGELTGYDAAAIESGEVSWAEDVIYPEDHDQLWEQVQTAMEADEPFQVTYRIRTADDELKWVWEQGRSIDRSADADVLEGFITDVTARKARERDLEVERRFTRKVIDALDDVFYVVTEDGDFLRWNQRMNEVTGYSDAELADMVVTDLFPEEYEDVVVQSAREATTSGSADFEAEILTKDGTRKPMDFRSTLVAVEDEDRTGICGIARDVSERNARERELRRYETVIQAIGDPVYVLDADGRFTFVNEALETLSGYEADTLRGEPVSTVLTDADVKRANGLVAELRRRDDEASGTFEMDIVTSTGDRIPCETHVGLLTDPDGAFAGTAGVIRDISDRKERERRLEEFASVVSHDLRNPLNVIQGRIELARETGDTEHLAAVEDAAGRMEQLIDELLTLARQGEGIGESEVLSLDAIARESWQLVDAPAAELLLEAPGEAEADPDRLRELFENLFRNAVEHGPDETGTVTIRVGATERGFFVADDGQGIPPDRRDAVLERGYTTSDEGTGFGLAIVADVVEAHDWTIEVTESRSGGARFDIET